MVAVSRPYRSGSSTSSKPPFHILVTIVLCGLSYYTGTLRSSSSPSSPSSSSAQLQVPVAADCEKIKNDAIQEMKMKMTPKRETELTEEEEEDRIESLVNERVHSILSHGHEEEEEKFLEQANKKHEGGTGGGGGGEGGGGKRQPSLLMETYSFLMNGIARVPKDEFVTTYDYGPPMDKGEGTNGQDAIILYNSPKAIPTSNSDHAHAIKNGNTGEDEGGGGGGGGLIPLLTTKEATENCDVMNVVTIPKSGYVKQCTVLVNNYENYHVQKWMRVNAERKGKLDRKEPLRVVNRGYSDNGVRHFTPPDDNSIKKHWKTLYTYLDTLDDVISRLSPVAKKVAKDNTIIVMTCNMGQSELLMNFVCNAKSRGFGLDNILVFPTDQETKELAEGLGLATFYDEKNFENTPEEEARGYGDRAFVAMMFAKVVCVQLINHLGYDLLFQDVDIVWYKNPLDYFHDEANKFHDFDVYFQDDGAHSARYAPTSANSGFYYVRNNARTKYLFASLLYAGDIILQSHSHQQALVQIMAEHASLFGLRVKVLSRDMEEFPGGWHYHKRNKEFMKKIVTGEVTPYIFHMSWTKNKDNKIKFFQQMGLWHVQDVCIAQTKSNILEHLDGDSGEAGTADENGNENPALLGPCCLAEPNIICHYRDKPSKIPCTDKDPIDKGRPSFW